MRRPLWQFHLIERYDGGSAVVMRIHHCYADGIALIQVMLSMTDADRAGKRAGPVPPPPRRSEDRSRRPAGDADPADGGNAEVRHENRRDIDRKRAWPLWHDPAKAVALAEQGSALTAEIAKLAMMGEDSRTRFKGKPGIAKRVAWADRLPLAEVKAIGRALDCSVNDVLLSSVAGALRSYLDRRGDDVAGVTVRALVPVNLRPPEKAWKLGNRFGLVFLDLPLGIENPVERLYAVRANMQKLKGSYQPLLALGHSRRHGRGPEAAAGPVAGGAGEECDRGDDQRSGPAAAALSRRREDRQPDVLGAAVGRHRHGRVDPVVQQRSAVWLGHRPQAMQRSRTMSSSALRRSSRSSCSRRCSRRGRGTRRRAPEQVEHELFYRHAG